MAYSDDGNHSYKTSGLVAAVVGFGFSHFVGLIALVPFVWLVIVLFILHRAKYDPRELHLLIALQAAQVGWFAIGALVVPGGFLAVGPDIAFGLALLLWAAFSRHLVPLVLICLLQLFGIYMNFQTLSGGDYTSDDARPILVHIVLRILIIGSAAYYFYIKHMDGANDGFVDAPLDE